MKLYNALILSNLCYKGINREIMIEVFTTKTNGKSRFAVSGLTLAVCPYLGLKIRG